MTNCSTWVLVVLIILFRVTLLRFHLTCHTGYVADTLFYRDRASANGLQCAFLGTDLFDVSFEDAVPRTISVAKPVSIRKLGSAILCLDWTFRSITPFTSTCEFVADRSLVTFIATTSLAQACGKIFFSVGLDVLRCPE